MAIDLFNNNPSNDYIHPDLAPCAGQADEAFFEFLPNEKVGIVSGNEEILAMDFANLSQRVKGWVQQKRILQQ